ncbi:hypothetical protein ACFS5M_06780 [Lacinutrix iliipiscaria]|uniref:DUF1579 domain-containing protein n=1 Tax=Lacinutrix iliipiscaria TaxID=1230532 RepID=A0ABW5WKY4_9FLAO
MKKITLYLLFFLIGIHFALAQNDSIKDPITIDKLNFMVGEWKGTGWMMTRNGKETTEITEKVEYKLENDIMVVEGLGTKTDSITKETKIVHDAFGVIFFDLKSNSLMINAYKKGEFIQSEIVLIEDKIIQWNMDIPNRGKVRFTVNFNTENKWLEIGEFSRDGTNWMTFLEMNLEKIK